MDDMFPHRYVNTGILCCDIIIVDYTVVNNNMIDGNPTIRVTEFTSQSQY